MVAGGAVGRGAADLQPVPGQPPQFVEIFNRGSTPFDYSVETGEPWLSVRPSSGSVEKQVWATVRVDWARAPRGTTDVPITVTGPSGSSVVVYAVVQNPTVPRSQLAGFVEANGYLSIEAEHVTKAGGGGGIGWTRIPGIGRTGAGMEPFPVTAASQTPGGSSPHLEYTLTLFGSDPVTVWAYLSPRNNVLPGSGLRYAVSIDDETPQVVNVTTATGANDTTMNRQWERNTPPTMWT